MDEFSTLVRSLLVDEFTDFDKHFQQLEARRSQDGFGEFLGSCFFLAVRRRFAPGQPLVDIIRLVANARVVYDLSGSDLDPAIAERLIRTALGAEDRLADANPHTIQKVQITLVHKLLTDEQLYEDEIEDFLNEAEALAVRWRTQAAIDMLESMGYTVEPPAKPARKRVGGRRSKARALPRGSSDPEIQASPSTDAALQPARLAS
ncbi:MAG: hypothetical protein ACRDTU_04090 [Micromonosporaceae bacterium]